jgi:hypothetical protein
MPPIRAALLEGVATPAVPFAGVDVSLTERLDGDVATLCVVDDTTVGATGGNDNVGGGVVARVVDASVEVFVIEHVRAVHLHSVTRFVEQFC